MLHDVGGAATIEQGNRKMVWQTAVIAALAALSCNASRLPSYLPLTPEGKSSARAPLVMCDCSALWPARLDIKYRDCVTGRRGPNPTACFRFARNLFYVNLLRISKFYRCAFNPPCRVGRQQWARCMAHPGPGPLLAQDFLRAVRAFVLVGNMGLMRGVVLQ